MQIDTSNIIWMYQLIAPKAGAVWGWFYCDRKVFEYSGIIDIINGNIGLVLDWTEHSTGLKSQEATKLMEFMKQGDFPQVGTPEELTKLMFGTDYRKAVINSLVYSKLSDSIVFKTLG